MPSLATTASRRVTWSKTLSVIVAFTLAGLGIVGLTAMFGGVHGEEFSPQRFQRRQFTYYRVPLIHWQVTPAFRKPTTNRLERFVKKSGHLGIPAQNARWDVVTQVTVANTRQLGAAHQLCAYLDMQDSAANLRWLEWSQAHHALSDLLWPAVVQTAQNGYYFAVPELMHAAKTAENVDELRQAIERIVQNAEELAAARQLDNAI